MLTGSIFITSQEEIIYKEDCITQLTRIISLDEDDVLPKNFPGLIGGTCLLPPPTAKIAEADGNEQLYDQIYSNHLILPFQQEYMAALISFLNIGGRLIIFLPSVGQDNTFDKLIYHIQGIYGIHIGNLDSKDPNAFNCWYDFTHINQWINLIYYYTNQFTGYQYLITYPYNSVIPDNVMKKLLMDLNPYGTSIEQKLDVIKSLRKELQINRNITLPVGGV